MCASSALIDYGGGIKEGMRPAILCRERLQRIQRVLGRTAGRSMSIRDLSRSHGVQKWELEQAAQLGWVEITIWKPVTGRPSLVAGLRKHSETPSAKVPPLRRNIGKMISGRHHNFALQSVHNAVKGGNRRFFLIPPLTDAYLRAFPDALKRHAAASSMSRLLRHPHVKAARAWFYAGVNAEIPKGERMPDTPGGIRERLRAVGSRFGWRF